jgi:hypothetical protein
MSGMHTERYSVGGCILLKALPKGGRGADVATVEGTVYSQTAMRKGMQTCPSCRFDLHPGCWVPVLRVPYGLQQTHPICRNFLQLTIRECTWASKCIQNLWLQNARVVQMQGRSVGSVLGTYRHVCKSVALELHAEQLANTLVETPQIPGYSGRACFRGDDSSLPVWLRRVTSLHCGYIPAQSLLHSSVMRKLAGQFTTIRRQLRFRAGQDAVWEA